jgi:hypothetical protein
VPQQTGWLHVQLVTYVEAVDMAAAAAAAAVGEMEKEKHRPRAHSLLILLLRDGRAVVYIGAVRTTYHWMQLLTTVGSS